MISDIRYAVRGCNGTRFPVRGMRVGRFAVRVALADTVVFAHDRSWSRPHRAFAVDHVGTGCAMGDFTRFDDALALADDISRFSRRDPSSRDPSRAAEQVGGLVVEWLRDCVSADRVTPYRAWLSSRFRKPQPEPLSL